MNKSDNQGAQNTPKSRQPFQVTDILQSVRCPVVIDGTTSNSGVATIELFVGRFPSLKFDVNHETVVTVSHVCTYMMFAQGWYDNFFSIRH